MDDNNNFTNGENPIGRNASQNTDPNAGYTDPNAGYTDPNAGYTGSNANYYAAPGGYDPNAPAAYAPVQNPYVNEIPAEVRKWNWGAFMFGWIWGIGNHAYLTLLGLAAYVIVFIPTLLNLFLLSIPFSLFSIVWAFICGGMGNRWAWKSGEFKDVETFLAVQKTWNKAGLVAFILSIVVVILCIVILVVVGISAASFVTGGYNSYY
ncbi:MAG: hypothetical protein LBQ21_04725 [Clostridiales Family XIII bacterium]|jgi:hypothetical protein|nr:hypothetical protein [Clostridiales Family XIII bacterium]